MEVKISKGEEEMIHIFKHEVQKDTDNVVKKQALIIGVVPVLKDV